MSYSIERNFRINTLIPGCFLGVLIRFIPLMMDAISGEMLTIREAGRPEHN
jgi:hypothetical protein